MKIEHWKQLKDFSEEEVVYLLNSKKAYNIVDSSGGWAIIKDTRKLFTAPNNIYSGFLNYYVKDIEKPILPFVFNK